MDDAVIPVAYAMHVSPKRYALLLGAGISISAGLPTGTDVSGNMIRKIAKGRGESIEGGDDPLICLDWFEKTFGVPATFDLLMEKLGISETNRSDGLLPFIIPRNEAGQPIPINPTPAHMAIAELVKEGLITTIITTNFDHLLEDAIKVATGIPPIIITGETDPSLMSVFPDKCRIVKVNGDFTSKILRITLEDLKSYDSPVEDYIRRICSEYGLVVCGWSGKFDTGLVEILKALKVRRYPMFWALRSDGEIPEVLKIALNPNSVQIESADEFFKVVHTIVERLTVAERGQILPIQVAVRKVTDALQQPRPELILSDLLHTETDKIIDFLAIEGYITEGTVDAKSVFNSRVSSLERRSAALAAMVATITFYDDKNHCELLLDIIERLINVHRVSPFPGSGHRNLQGFSSGGKIFSACLNRLQFLPALLVIYSAGIAAIKSDHFNMLNAIIAPRINIWKGIGEKDTPYHEKINIHTVLSCDDLFIGLNRERFNEDGDTFTYPHRILHGILHHILPSDNRFIENFDVFEYLYALTYIRAYQIEAIDPRNPPLPLMTSVWVQTVGYAGRGRLAFPEHVSSFVSGISRSIKGSAFFCGSDIDFERCNRKYSELFGIEPINTGISIPRGVL